MGAKQQDMPDCRGTHRSPDGWSRVAKTAKRRQHRWIEAQEAEDGVKISQAVSRIQSGGANER
jgi:hypothetical protein